MANKKPTKPDKKVEESKKVDTSKKLNFDKEKPEIKTEEKPKPNLEEIKKIQDEHSDLKENVTVKTRKQRRTKKEMEADKATDKIERAKSFSDSITGVGSMLLSIMVERMPTPKPLTELEKNMFDNSFNKLAYKYAEWLGDYQEETAFILVASMVIIPRMKKPKEIIKEEEKTTE